MILLRDREVQKYGMPFCKYVSTYVRMYVCMYVCINDDWHLDVSQGEYYTKRMY